MKTGIFLILFSFAALVNSDLFGQQVVYKGGTIELSQNKNGTRKPLGKNVKVVFDSFFKSYKVTFTDVNGITRTMLFEYVKFQTYVCEGVQYETFMEEFGLKPEKLKRGFGFINFTSSGYTYGISNLSYAK